LHLVDATVAGDTPDARCDVRLVCEIRVVGKLVDANPAHRPAAGRAVANRRERGAVAFHRLMTVHARLGRWNVRDRRGLDRGVTVAAIETQLADVKPVAIRDGLYGTVADVGVPRGKVVPDARYRERRTEAARNGSHDRELVPPGRKDLAQWLRLLSAGGQ